MTALPVSGFLSNAARTDQNMKDALEDQRTFIEEGVGATAATTLTIGNGTITPTHARHAVDTEGAASIDELANIALTNLPDGRWLVLEHADVSRVVIIKHLAGGNGEIETVAGHDIKLQNRTRVILERSGTRWRQVMETLTPGPPTGTSAPFWGDEANKYPRSELMYGQTLPVAENPELAARCPGLVVGSDIVLPDTRERVIVGKNSAASPTSRIDSGYLDTSSVGNTGGADDILLADANVPLREHLHGDGSLTAVDHLHYLNLGLAIFADGNHAHTYEDRGSGTQNVGGSGETVASNQSPNRTTFASGWHAHGGSVAGNTFLSGALDVYGSTAATSAAATVPVGLVQPGIVACQIIGL